MEVVYPRCCGLDLHKRSLTACLITPGDEQAHKAVRSFGTTTPDLLALADWLVEAGCTHVAMESTGVYWKPVWNLLEDQFTLLLVNAQHIKAVPGRKSDVKDCAWIADLLRHGLLQGSFVPARPERELRELTRYRTSLVRERSAEVNRLQQTLEGANIKLAAVATEVTGVSGRAMLAALVAGTTDAHDLAGLAKGHLRRKQGELERALQGRFGAHQRFLVARQLAHIDFLEEQIAQVSAEIAERLRPFDDLIERLDGIPGIGRWTAEVLLAEIGPDMTRFPSAKHLASWAGMCPGSHESGGKRSSGATRKGSPWLRVALTEAAYAAGRSQGTYLADHYHRLVRRRGRKKAAVAVGHSILVIVYHLLRTAHDYQDLGPDYLATRNRMAEERRLIRRLERLGNKVTVEPLQAA
jgi:transposase